MDGKVTISTELDNSSIPNGLKEIKGQLGGLNGTLNQTQKAITSAFSKPIALAQARVADLERQYSRVTAQFNAAKLSDNDSAAQRLGLRQEAIYDRLAAARNRLAIEVQAAAQLQASAENHATTTQETRVAAAFSRIRSLANGIRTAISNAFASAKTVMSGFAKVISRIRSRFAVLGKTANHFGTRLRGVVSSALLFGMISIGLRKVISYFGRAIGSASEMKSALATLRGAAESAAAPIIQVLTPALAALANMAATVLAYVAQLITLFTGKVADAAKQAAGAAGAAKKAARSLAGFDEITKLDDSKDSGGGASTPSSNIPEVTMPDWAQMVVENLKAGEWSNAAKVLTEKINSVFDAADWNAIGDKMANGIDGALAFLATAILTFDWNGLGTHLATSINTIINSVDWANLGVVMGAKFIAITETLGGLFGTIDWAGIGQAIAASIMGLWNAIDWQQAAASLSSGLVGTITSIGTALKNIEWQKIGNDVALFIASIDWSGLVSSLSNGIGAALGGLAAFLWGLIEGAWNDVVKWWYDTAFDDGGFTMEGLLNGIWQAIKDVGKWIYDKIFKPFVDGFEEAFKINSPSKVMEDEGGFVIAGLFNGIVTAWKAITNFFNDAISWFRNTFGNITQIASNSWQAIKQAWSVVAGWFDRTIISPLSQAFTNFWSNLTSWAVQAWNGITGVFGSAGQWFGKTFGDAWEKVKKVFSSGGKVFDGIKEGIVSSFKSIVNSLISGINRVIAKPFEGLNAAIRKIRSVSVLGLYPFSGLSTVSVPSIPYLAQGAVLPANKPFMAVVGDQRHGTNIEAPLSTIQEAVAIVMEDMVQSNIAGHEATVAVLQAILEAVNAIDTSDERYATAVDSYNRKIAVSRGV